MLKFGRDLFKRGLITFSFIIVTFVPRMTMAQPYDEPVINIGDATITGVREANGTRAFYGIPFAAAPIEGLRFKEAIAELKITGNMRAQTFAPACPQDQGNVNLYKSVATGVGSDPDSIPSLENISEDCLYLNIWAPKELKKDLPVMVWVHGGSNINGWSHEVNYRGLHLANKDVIIVSVAYRMGELGFLPVPFENAADKHSANWGISDLVASLEWVNKFIQNFGGDPENITLFGESSGGGNIAALMLTPSAEGLFHKAIIQSGAIGPATIDKDKALKVAKKMYDIAGIKSLDQALETEWQDLIGLPRKTKTPYYHRIVADGHYTLAAPNYLSDVPLLIGANKNESLMYLSDDFAESLAQDLKKYANEGELKTFLRHYSEDPRVQADFFGSAKEFFCPSLEIATKIKSDSYVYQFTREREGAAAIGAYHGAEISYVFGTHDNWLPTNDTDKALSELMMNYWVNFAKTGNPNDEILPTWQTYSPDDHYIQELGEVVRRSDGQVENLCKLLR